ncbi:MAG: hypothetical protein ACJ747_06090 [Gaiellaceae bacterium]
MRVLLLIVVFAATSLVLGAWTSESDAVPTCAGHVQKLMCRRGSALVTFKGITYRMKGSRCYVGAKGGRLYFGPQPDGGYKGKNGLMLVVEPNRVGAVDVIDGGLGLASGVHGAILGKAHAITAELRRGTFTLSGHLGAGKTDNRRFTGSWHCG